MEPLRRSWCRSDERPPRADQFEPIMGRWMVEADFDLNPPLPLEVGALAFGLAGDSGGLFGRGPFGLVAVPARADQQSDPSHPTFP